MFRAIKKPLKASILFLVLLVLVLLIQIERKTNGIYKNVATVYKPDVRDILVGDHRLNKTQEILMSSFPKPKLFDILNETERSTLSNLGRILYLEENFPYVNTSLKTYKILIWKHGKLLERRHIKHFTDHRFDPFANCSVKNCIISYEDGDLEQADLVLFHLHQTRSAEGLPKRTNLQQIWTFLTDESPYHTFLFSKNNRLPNYNGLFNWSMNYRMDADIPVPYGRTVTLKAGEKADFQTIEEWNKSKRQDVIVAVMGSNCGGRNHRWKYIKELQKHIDIDIYGGCGKLKCSGHFSNDCKNISNYKFYLAFENSNCDGYITEKLWWNGFAKNAIPVVMGSHRKIYNQLLPPHSYIHVDDFESPRSFSDYLIYLNNTTNELEKYFEWKTKFRVLNEHGYFKSSSVHYCRICEALSYNSKDTKIYTDLHKFWSTDNCYKAWDE